MPRLARPHKYSFAHSRSSGWSTGSESSSVGSILRGLSLRIRTIREKKPKTTTSDHNIVETQVRRARSRDRKRGLKEIKDRPNPESHKPPQARRGMTTCRRPGQLTECSPEDYFSIIQELQAFDVREAAGSLSESEVPRSSPSRILYRAYAKVILSKCNPDSLLNRPPSKRSPVG